MFLGKSRKLFLIKYKKNVFNKNCSKFWFLNKIGQNVIF